ncbi:MAG: polysaccharide pyruvyl transferase family protein, partial [Desulfurococcaceae archaeon]|nr:polysaccharide pyruvyl transferase family protein [Desulfurococcaceae archaeon]
YIKLKKKLKIKFLEYIDPFEFLRLIAMSRYTITNSYHGTIFSILFEKNFITILPRGKSIRILDLLNLLGLRDRAVYDVNEALKRLEEEVEYKGVREKLEFHRRRSYNFLISAIKGGI